MKMKNKDYTYCIGACEPICNRCKRHVPPTEASTPDKQWWMQPEAKDDKCPNIDYRTCGGCAHFLAQGHLFGSNNTIGLCAKWKELFDEDKYFIIHDHACEHFKKDK